MKVTNSNRLFLGSVMAVLGVLAFCISDAGAFETYDGCKTCHEIPGESGFVAFGPSHARHTGKLEGCTACHTTFPGEKPVLIGLDCVGCHGREDDAGNDSVFGQPEPANIGAGLRQHHTNEGVSSCKGCHSDADPANYTPVGEHVLPPFYAAGLVDNNDPATDGLDNDGDLLTDGADPDNTPVNLPPVIESITPLTGVVDQEVVFTAVVSDPEGDPITYLWVIDSTPIIDPFAGATYAHTFTTTGSHTVELAVLAAPDGAASAQITVEITEAVNLPPEVDPVGPFEGMVNEEIQLSVSASDPEGEPLEYTWDFGDGPVAGGATATHSYAEVGEHLGSVSVSDGVNEVVEDFVVTVSELPPPPEGNNWTVRIPLLQASFNIEFEEFAGFLIGRTSSPGGQSSIAIGWEFNGVILWMDVSGPIFFGTMDPDAGTGAGIVLNYAGSTSIWIAERY